jgi:hypothetical protein
LHETRSRPIGRLGEAPSAKRRDLIAGDEPPEPFSVLQGFKSAANFRWERSPTTEKLLAIAKA